MDNSGNLLISGATMVLPNITKAGDLRITNGVIAEIGDSGTLENYDDEMFVDGTGLHLLPGCIDPQVHFRDPGQPEKEDLEVALLLQLVGALPHSWICQTMFHRLLHLKECKAN